MYFYLIFLLIVISGPQIRWKTVRKKSFFSFFTLCFLLIYFENVIVIIIINNNNDGNIHHHHQSKAKFNNGETKNPFHEFSFKQL